jgi:hypothetical protein
MINKRRIFRLTLFAVLAAVVAFIALSVYCIQTEKPTPYRQLSPEEVTRLLEEEDPASVEFVNRILRQKED